MQWTILLCEKLLPIDILVDLYLCGYIDRLSLRTEYKLLPVYQLAFYLVPANIGY